MQVVTRFESHPVSGRGRIVAKFGGRQATVGYDSALSPEANHRAAADALMARLDVGFVVTEVVGEARPLGEGRDAGLVWGTKLSVS